MMAATEIKEFLAWRGAVSFGHICIMNAAQWLPCLFNRESLAFYIFPEYRKVFMSKDIKQGGTFKILLLFYFIRWNEQKPSGSSSLVCLNISVFLNCIMKAWFIHASSFSIQDTNNMKKKSPEEVVVEIFPDIFLVNTVGFQDLWRIKYESMFFF